MRGRRASRAVAFILLWLAEPMRRSPLLLVVPLSLWACHSAIQTTSVDDDAGTTAIVDAATDEDGKKPSKPRPKPDADDGTDEDEDAGDPSNIDESVFAEEVYVFMRSQFSLWMCTGTLVSPTVVVTAAHCLDTSMFDSYFVVAPQAPGRVQREAHHPQAFGGSFEDVANPDIGILTLEKPIVLPRYAQLTDVVDAVEAATAASLDADEDAGDGGDDAGDGGDDAGDGGDAGSDAGVPGVFGAAYVRTSQDNAESPLTWTGDMPVTSTIQYGYSHGFGTPMYSKGGDSGAGLFLVENGVKKHKLIGVERQPEPSRNLDHFTRIDAAFVAWFNEVTKTP